MIVDELKQLIAEAAAAAGQPELSFRLEHPADLANGDYAVNLRGVAALVAEKINQQKPEWLEKVETAGPGFVNFYLSPQFFAGEIKKILEQKDRYGWSDPPAGGLTGQKTIVEYTDPNPFKEFHIGHLMSNAIGESLSRLIESQGAEVKRACYQGDVGLHVAKALWGVQALKLEKITAPGLGEAYAYGATQGDEAAIKELNKKLYERSDSALNDLYDAGRQVSLEYFEQIYRRLGTQFDFKFFESATGEFGKKVVTEKVGEIFSESDGAIIFPGEKYGLHTRVFINSQGLPTYEAKELGLAKIKYDTYPYDRSIVVTGNEIKEYFKVLLKAMSLVFPELALKTQHVAHGMLRLPTGKMSSRTGEVITAESLLAEVKEKGGERVTEEIAVAAVKYSILRQAPGRDIIFDLDKSISFEGDSGPYLQYTAVRARSILEKVGRGGEVGEFVAAGEVEKRLTRFPGVVARAAAELAPQHVVTYLTELASAFNAYYAQNQIIGSAEESYRLALTAAVAQVLANGLWLLGIKVPAKM